MDLTIDEIFTYLIDAEWDEKHNQRLARLTRAARFRYQVALDEIDYTPDRNLYKNLILRYGVTQLYSSSIVPRNP